MRLTLRLGAALLLFCFSAPSAQAVTIGPALTKLEREKREGSRSVSSSRGYEGVLENFLKGDFAQSEKQAARFLARAKRPDPVTDEVSYLRALSLMKLGRFTEARPMLQELEGEAASGRLRAQAAYSLGDSFYFEQKRAEADIYYKEAVQKYPQHGEAEQIRRLVGLSRPPLQQMAVEEAVAATTAVYSVQVGAFARRRNAERLLNKLLRNRYDAYINREDASHFRVRVGHLEGLEEARGLESRLKKDGYPTKIFP